MALTPEEREELLRLEAEQEGLRSEYDSILEKMNPPEEQNPTMLGAAGRGFSQGLSFGFADEITAGAESTLTGVTYKKALEESRAAYKAAEEEYPITSALSGLAGGVVQGVGISAVTGGAAAPAALGANASKVAKIGNLVGSALKSGVNSAFIPSVSKSAMTNVGTAALAGATQSALSELGQSEKDGFVARLEEVPMAALTGAIVGGGLGGVIEGGKKAAKKVVSFVNKQIDEGNAPATAEKVRELWRQGTAGQGFVTVKSNREIDASVEKAAEDSVDLIQNSLDEVRGIKNQILRNVDQPINVTPTLTKLTDDLSQMAAENLSDSAPALKRIQGLMATKLTEGSDEISAQSANDLIYKIEDYLQTNPESSEQLKNAMRTAINDLKLNLRISVKPEAVDKALRIRKDTLDKYVKRATSIDDEVLQNSSILTAYEKKFFAGLKGSITKKAKKGEVISDLKETLKSARKGKPKPSKASDKFSNEDVEEILKEGTDVLKQKAMLSPLGRLDAIMHEILNASENLGGLTRADGSQLKRKFKMFDVLRGNTSDTGTGKKAVMKYEEAVQNLKKASPELADEFNKITGPAIKKLESQKFLEGSKLGEGPRDSGALKQWLNLPGMVTGLTGNVLAQTVESQPAKSILRPTLSYLEKSKKKVSDALIVDPDNGLLKRLEAGLNSALSQKDESRRAAILNTLMQYESVRKLFKEEGQE